MDEFYGVEKVLMMKFSIHPRLLTLAAIASTLTVASPAWTQNTALPMTISTAEGTFNLTVPDTDTTSSAYGGKLRVYDVHIAKMVEVTHFMCTSGRLSPGTVWSYTAGNGAIDMGNFQVSCRLASDLAIAYGLGKPERTAINVSFEEAGRATRVVNVPILAIAGGKVDRWMSFTRNFRPTR